MTCAAYAEGLERCCPMEQSQPGYYSFRRAEMIARVPTSARRILEIGCAAGAAMEELRKRQPIQWAGGVELVVEQAEKARAFFEQVWIENIELTQIESDIPDKSIDAILCFDVLEHLINPWEVVKRLTPKLSMNGVLIICVPNIRNWKFIRDLLFKGEFIYRDSGLLDRTHLRFFVKETATELATCGGLQLTDISPANKFRPRFFKKMLSVLTGGRIDPLFIIQWAVVATRK